MIKKLQRNDALSYRSMRLMALQTDPDAYYSTFDELSLQPLYFFESELFSKEQSPFGYYGYFEPNNTLSAYLSLQESYSRKQLHVADLMNLYVHPEMRKQGIATKLLTHVIEKAKQNTQLQTLFLTVTSNNVSAIAIYKQFGFYQFAIKTGSILAGTKYLDEVFMRLDLRTSK